MATTIIYQANIPPRTIILWDAKYRKEGGYYPKFRNANLIKWKPDIIAALISPGGRTPGRLCGSDLRHINGQIGECNSYQMLLKNGHYGIAPPGPTSATGSDYITYFHEDPMTGDVMGFIYDALNHNRIIGRIFRWPECIVTD